MEQHAWPERSWFLTLTIDDDHIEVTEDGHPTLRKAPTRQFLANRQKRGPSFRYYLVGEYGDLSLRPHYHLALFPEPGAGPEIVTDYWQYGFTQATEMTRERAGYLAQYTTKKLTKAGDERLERGQEPEFRTSTRKPPIGAAFIQPLVQHYQGKHGSGILAERGDIERTIRFDGRVYPIAPYILDKVRAELGVPLRHADRMCHPGYSEWHRLEDTEKCARQHDASEVMARAKAKRRRSRRSAI